MPPTKKLILKDFVIPSLNERRYCDLLKWVDKEKGHFLQGAHKSAANWTPADSSVFQDWDKMKGRYNPDEKNYYMYSKQRFGAALKKPKNNDDFSTFDETSVPHKLSSRELNDLVRDWDLSKSKAELLASRLRQWNLLEHNVRVIFFRNRHQSFVRFFRKEKSLVFCSNSDGLLKELGIAHEPQEWWLFLDASKLSLKAVLLHNGNKLPSIPIGHAVYMKET
ncbi:hypothetical protein JTE90_007011 [Oedothorax gibbosus]|uniref:IRF tryptophan pentad repeat domain-containing protein n=1 Tax=Oedothorax gibbosus TaxID=931172 RepID=A0AAV6TW68_9ARAC|nr:hypothetical protein JTE90_007011 [Oedothorax gibbosus]